MSISISRNIFAVSRIVFLRRKDVHSAVRYLKNTKNAGCYVFLIADKKGNGAVVEAVPGRVEADKSSDVITRANHFELEGIVEASKQKIPDQYQVTIH